MMELISACLGSQNFVLKFWKNHFQNLLFSDKNDDQSQFDCVKLFDVNLETSTAEFKEKKITDFLKAIKLNKTPDFDGFIPEA